MTPSTRRFAARSGQAHLHDTEFVDLIDGALSAERTQHVERCPACRAKADELAAALTAAATDDVPEPSPQFWDQFSARVRTAVANEQHRTGTFQRLLEPTAFRWAVLVAAAVLVLAIGLRPATIFRPSSEPAQPGARVANLADPYGDDTFGDIDADEGWALVRTFADDLAADDLVGAAVTAHPGSTEGMVLRLSDRERIELAQLLQAEIKRRRRTEASS